MGQCYAKQNNRKSKKVCPEIVYGPLNRLDQTLYDARSALNDKEKIKKYCELILQLKSLSLNQLRNNQDNSKTIIKLGKAYFELGNVYYLARHYIKAKEEYEKAARNNHEKAKERVTHLNALVASDLIDVKQENEQREILEATMITLTLNLTNTNRNNNDPDPSMPLIFSAGATSANVKEDPSNPSKMLKSGFTAI